MDVVRTIKPGDKGSHRFLKKYGEQLVAVRYRKTSSHRITTIELIVERTPLQKPIDSDTLVELRIRYSETDLYIKINQAGGSWNKQKKVWQLEYKNAIALGLIDRIISIPHKK